MYLYTIEPISTFRVQLTCCCSLARHYCLPYPHTLQLDSEDNVLTPAMRQAWIDIFVEAGMEMYEGMAAILVEEQPPPDVCKVQRILDMMGLQEQMGSQLYAKYDVLAAGREGGGRGSGVAGCVGLLLNRCLPCGGYRQKHIEWRVVHTEYILVKTGFFFDELFIWCETHATV